jgi:hypothetical protein
MGAQATTCAVYTADQWAVRLLQVFPLRWTSDEARTASGILYSWFKTTGTQYNYLEQNLDWLLDSERLQTAQDVALDAFAADYFGKVYGIDLSVVRAPGQNDASFLQTIINNLLQPGGTRADINRILTNLTGQAPRIVEPWNVMDTCSFKGISYWGVDTPSNPGRFGGYRPFQAFVEAVMPGWAGLSYPYWGFNSPGMCFNNSYFMPQQTNWLTGAQLLDNAINKLRMTNTVVWRRYFNSPNSSIARGGTLAQPAGQNSQSVLLVPACESSLVILLQANWNSGSWAKMKAFNQFVANFEVEAGSSATFDWICAPMTVPGFGIYPISGTLLSKTIPVPLAGQTMFVTPSWNTNVWLSSEETTTAALNFNVASPGGGALYYGCLPAANCGNVSVTAGSESASVTFNTPLVGSYQLMLLPGWNTEFQITKSSSGFTVNFSSTPTADSFFIWGYFQQS